MQIAVIGLPQSGKTTVLETISSGHISHRENIATVKVPDSPLEKIGEVMGSKKITPVEIEFLDTVGDISKGGAIFSEIQGVFGIIIVLRGFDGGFGEPNPTEDARKIRKAIVDFDRSAIETRINSLSSEINKRASGNQRQQMEKDLQILHKFSTELKEGKFIREFCSHDLEKKLARNQGLISAKPWFTIVNSEEKCSLENEDEISSILRSNVSIFPAKLLLELKELTPEESSAFMDEFDIQQNIIEQLIYEIIDWFGFVKFYTANERESHAWIVPAGTSALKAAGKIHSDIQKGFIRAEIIHWEKFVSAGGYSEARKKNLFHTEGKDYIVHNGDLIYYRFNV